MAESVLCGLNGLYVASDALLRPFLEFNLLQLYYYRLIRQSGAYSPLEEYFKKGRHASWNTVMSKALPSDSFCGPIRFRIGTHLAGLSESSVHPYHPDHSPTQHRASSHGHSLEGVFFWQKTSLILEAALWIYYVNFPLLFHPVEVLRKFGFNGPVGVVIDRQCAEFVKRSLSLEDYEAFRDYSSRQDNVSSVLGWVAGHRDLTDEEIRSGWDDKEDGTFPGIIEAYCCRMAKLRALRVAMAFRGRERTDPPEELVRSMATLGGWRQLSKREKPGPT